MAQQNRDLSTYTKITGLQCEKLRIRHLPLNINYGSFKKTPEDKIKLANAKSSYNKMKKNDPSRHRILHDVLAGEMLTYPAPKWGGLKLNGIKLGM